MNDKQELRVVNEMFKREKTECFYFYKEHEEELKNWKFIGCEVFGTNEMPKMIQTKTLSSNAYLINFFKYPFLFFIESKTTKMNTAHYYTDYSVSLDANILSYMERFLLENGTAIPYNFEKILAYLLINDINVDPYEYLYENKKDWEKKKIQIEKTLYTYEVFKNADVKTWIKEKRLISSINHNSIMAKMKQEEPDLEKVLVETHKNREKIFNICYVILLKICLIGVEHSKKSCENKLKMFLEYLNNVLGFLPHREIIIAKEYFMHGRNLTFFKKVDKGMKNPIETIKNMAWDLTHLRNIERNQVLMAAEGVYFIPCLLTMDKGLAEITKLCSISMVAINQKKNNMVVCYDEIKKLQNPELYDKWFNEEMFQRRTPINDIELEVKKLEEAFVYLVNKEKKCE